MLEKWSSRLISVKVRRIFIPIVLGVIALCSSTNLCAAAELPQGRQVPWDSAHNGNPFIPGYYADASVLQVGGEVFIYATEDPWGTRELGCWHSKNFEHWQSCKLNWPTKEDATSSTSKDSMVWAPSVVRGRDGRFYMYVSVGSEVWVGTAEHPDGPWRNALGNRPLIPSNFKPAYHMIDAEVFLDTDGQAYLYWGSGLNWVNGHCFVVRLKPDMISFDGEPQDVTPPHYFEGPFMYKRNGRYYLMYSEGKTTDSSYNVRYSVGASPFGPFREGVNSPVLQSDSANSILGPGHHAVFDRDNKTYIVYHRHSLPFDGTEVKRQLCIDELTFGPNGEMQRVVPTHLGPELLRQEGRDKGSVPSEATASSSLDSLHAPGRVVDDNYATRWAPVPQDNAPWLQLDFGKTRKLSHTEIRFEYPWKVYRFVLMASIDGKQWTTVANQEQSGISGSPVRFDHLPRARYLRLSFPTEEGKHVSVFEWTTY